LDLPDQCQEVRIVVYSIIGQLCLLVYRNLKIFANIDVLSIHAAGLPEPFVAPLPVAFYKDQSVTTVCPAYFHQQGHIEYNRFYIGVGIVPGDQFLDSFEHEGVAHLVQRGQPLSIRKDDSSQFLSVDPARGLKDFPSEQLTNPITNAIFPEQFVNDDIGVDDSAPQLCELRGHSALAGGDSAEDSNNWLSPGIAHVQAALLLTPTL